MASIHRIDSFWTSINYDLSFEEMISAAAYDSVSGSLFEAKSSLCLNLSRKGVQLIELELFQCNGSFTIPQIIEELKLDQKRCLGGLPELCALKASGVNTYPVVALEARWQKGEHLYVPIQREWRGVLALRLQRWNPAAKLGEHYKFVTFPK